MKYFLLLSIIIFFYGCSLTKQIENTGYSVINFGSGGGFTNETTMYSLFPSGELWMHKNLSGDSSLIAELKKLQIKNIYLNIQQSGLDTIQFQHPKNIYYFIEIHKQSITNRISWGSGDPNTPRKVIAIYNELLEETKH